MPSGIPAKPTGVASGTNQRTICPGQPDPELKKYLWVVIRTRKDRKLQTLIEACTDFASIAQPTTVQPVEQVFAIEEEEDPEDMIAMVEQLQWTGRGATEPHMSPSLQQMFALARRMGYEMRPIARCSDNYFLLRGPLSLDTQMLLNMKLTPVILHPYIAHPAGCPPRR